MGSIKELEGLSSVLEMPGGDLRPVREMTVQDWEECLHQMEENVKRALAQHYRQYPEEKENIS